MRCSVTKGLDTGFLVQCEIAEHSGHKAARRLLERFVAKNERLAVAPQVLSEFLHVVTDPRRFERPLDVSDALTRAFRWWNGRSVVQVFPSDASTVLFLDWMRQHRLGRKRLLDTQLAATYYCADIQTLVSTNARDFSVFGCFTILTV